VPHRRDGLGQAIGHDTEVGDLATLAASERHGGVAVGIDDLAEAWRCARHHQFVARCQYRYFRAAMDGDHGVVHGSGEGQIAIGQTTPLGKEGRSALKVEPLGADVLPLA
jgi:hypothetical protein